MKILYLDTETTGTDPLKHGLAQIAGMLTVDSKIVKRFDMKLRTFPTDVIEDQALEVNGLDRIAIARFPAPQLAYDMLIALLSEHCDKFNRLDKIHLVAYNGDFDAAFLRKFFEKCGDSYFGSWFYWPIIDVSKVAGIRLMRERHLLKDFKLATVAAHVGIGFDPEALHDATADVELTIKLFKVLMADVPQFQMAAQ